jgi:hypothetical protein
VIYCIEYSSFKNRSQLSSRNTLLGLKKLTGVKPTIRWVGSLDEFKLALGYWNKHKGDELNILYLSFHGSPGTLSIGNRSWPLLKLAPLFRSDNFLFHLILSSCNVLNCNSDTLSKFLEATNFDSIYGYRSAVRMSRVYKKERRLLASLLTD